MRRKRVIYFILFMFVVNITVQIFGNESKEQNPATKETGFQMEERGLSNSILNMKPGVVTYTNDMVTTSIYIQNILQKPGEKDKWIKLNSGAYYKEFAQGKGDSLSPESGVFVHYKLSLDDGTELENTFKNREIFSFVIGRGELYPFFEECISTMREGGKRRLIVPARSVFGNQESKYKDHPISPDKTLIFDISLCWLRKPEWNKVNLFK